MQTSRRCLWIIAGFVMVGLGLIAGSQTIGADDMPSAEVAKLLKDIRAVGPQGTGAPKARAAWDKLVTYGPEVLPQILEAMDTPDAVARNWLRTAFDAIAERELKAGGKRIPIESLLAFVKDAQRHGRARRLALELVDQVQPGTSAKLIPGWLDDPEFRYEAVASLAEEAAKALNAGDKNEARTAYTKAYQAARDPDQVRTLAQRLKGVGVEVDHLEHLGFLPEWFFIGPFDGKGMTGFKNIYPPEEKVDLNATYEGKAGKITWKRARALPAADAGQRVGLINLPKVIGPAEDAVAYAYTAFQTPEAIEVEFRGAADDNFTVWVNGRIEFLFEEYRNGVRPDRHRFKVRLQHGGNTVLVKVCQAPSDAANTEPNWEFLLRVVDGTGKGLRFKSLLPKE